MEDKPANAKTRVMGKMNYAQMINKSCLRDFCERIKQAIQYLRIIGLLLVTAYLLTVFYRCLNSGRPLRFSGEEGLYFQTWYAWTTTLA